MNKKLIVATSLAAFQITFQCLAQVVYSSNGSTYSQDFNSINSTTWANNSTITGWSLFNKTPTAITSVVIDNGTGITRSFAIYGTTSAPDRALGTLTGGTDYFGIPSAGTVAGYIAVGLLNSSGVTLGSFTVSYDGEQWRNSNNLNRHSLVMQYGVGASFTAVTTWTAAGSGFNFTSPIATATAGALDGNAAANRRAGLGGTVQIGSSWADGSTLWLRWVVNNEVGNDHGLAIDNFSFVAVPEPSEYAAMAGAGLIGFAVWRRRSVRKA
jgi:hypothetical protein